MGSKGITYVHQLVELIQSVPSSIHALSINLSIDSLPETDFSEATLPINNAHTSAPSMPEGEYPGEICLTDSPKERQTLSSSATKDATP